MSRKNIVFIVTDQLRYDALGVNGNEVCRTPNLDALAAEGCNFDHAYTTCPLCSPARASILTGRLPHRHGLLTNSGQEQTASELPDGEVTFSNLLSDAGYACGYIGKWHVGVRLGPEDWGFRVSPERSMGDYMRAFGKRPVLSDPQTSRVNNTNFILAARRDGDPRQDQTGYCVDEGGKMLERLSAGSAPFLLRIDLVAPHPPYIVPEPYASMYDPAGIRLEESLISERYENKPRVHAIQEERWGLEGVSPDEWKRIIARYYGLVTQTDAAVGEIMAKCTELGILDETVIIFTSDHGDAVGSHGMYDKGFCMYEEQVRVPLIVRYPDGVSGVCSDEWVSLMDTMPTVLEIADCELPEELSIDGKSLVPVLTGQGSVNRDTMVSEFHGMQYGLASVRMVRDDRYKYVMNANDLNELYDLENDPDELRNLSGVMEYETVEAEMHRKLLRWMRETDDPMLKTLWGTAAYDPDYDPPPDSMWVWRE